MAEEDKNSEANEPGQHYSKTNAPLSQIFKNIVISSLEEQEEEMRRYSASLTPIERMAYLQLLIKIAYGHILNNPSLNLWEKKIYIDKIK